MEVLKQLRKRFENVNNSVSKVGSRSYVSVHGGSSD